MLYGSPKESLTLPGNGSGSAGGVRAVGGFVMYPSPAIGCPCPLFLAMDSFPPELPKNTSP